MIHEFSELENGKKGQLEPPNLGHEILDTIVSAKYVNWLVTIKHYAFAFAFNSVPEILCTESRILCTDLPVPSFVFRILSLEFLAPTSAFCSGRDNI